MLKIEAIKREAVLRKKTRKVKTTEEKEATHGFPLYPRNYGKSIHINI